MYGSGDGEPMTHVSKMTRYPLFTDGATSTKEITIDATAAAEFQDSIWV